MTGDDNIIHVLQDLVYEAAYIRIPPFLFGIGMGYVMLRTRNSRINMNTVLDLFNVFLLFFCRELFLFYG